MPQLENQSSQQVTEQLQPIDPTEAEPLISSVSVLGWQVPEEVEPLTPEEKEEQEAIERSKTPYEIWRDAPTQDNLYNLVDSLKPTIQASVASLGGVDANIKSRARVIAAKAVQTYDPSKGTSLPTWVSQQIRQITRDIRKSNNILSVPENAQLEAYSLYKTEAELEDELGRPPTVEEIADKAHISVRKIEKLRKKIKAIATDSQMQAEDGSSYVQGSETDYTPDALDYIYNDSDLKDKQLIEHMFGYGGSEIWDNQQIQNNLKLTPVQFTRRKIRLAGRIQNIMDNLEHV